MTSTNATKAVEAARELNASDPISDLFDVASDFEAEILRGLRERAGHTWEHEGCWTNEASDTACGRCGASRAEVPGSVRNSVCEAVF